MFTLQVHIPTNSILGQHISILQHVVSVALVSAIRSLPDYEVRLSNIKTNINDTNRHVTLLVYIHFIYTSSEVNLNYRQYF